MRRMKAERDADGVVRFRRGVVYQTDERSLCVGRFVDRAGNERVKFVSANDARDDLREFGSVSDEICEECAVRVFDGIERATQCDDTDDIEDFDIRADRPLGEMPLVDYATANRRNAGKRTQGKQGKRGKRTKNGNPIAGLITIAVIVMIVRACSSVR